MSTTWYTSDLHLGHRRIVELSHRPFASTEEHDQHFVDLWKSTIKSDDIVWILGDLSIESTWKYALDLLEPLAGRKRLVTGNHDQAWTGKPDFMKYMKDYLRVFEIVTPWARTKINGNKVNLSHFPYVGDHTRESRFDMYRLPLSDRSIIHGHTHSTEKVSDVVMPPNETYVKQIHVGVDSWNYQFVTMNEVAELL